VKDYENKKKTNDYSQKIKNGTIPRKNNDYVCLNWLRKIVFVVKMNIQNDIIAILSKEMKTNLMSMKKQTIIT